MHTGAAEKKSIRTQVLNPLKLVKYDTRILRDTPATFLRSPFLPLSYTQGGTLQSFSHMHTQTHKHSHLVARLSALVKLHERLVVAGAVYNHSGTDLQHMTSITTPQTKLTLTRTVRVAV